MKMMREDGPFIMNKKSTFKDYAQTRIMKKRVHGCETVFPMKEPVCNESSPSGLHTRINYELHSLKVAQAQVIAK